MKSLEMLDLKPEQYMDKDLATVDCQWLKEAEEYA
jgi:hypothetical protein